MVYVPTLLGFFATLVSKENQGFWSLTGLKQEQCDIKWRVYKTCTTTLDYKEYCVEAGLDMFASEFYNQTLKDIVFLSNPFLSNFSNYNVKPMIEALTSRCEFNLIALDNIVHTNAESVFDYPLTVLQTYSASKGWSWCWSDDGNLVPKDSRRYAKVLNEALKVGLFSTKKVTALGFSLGAQMSGHVCRQLDEKCGHILGIDPAGPLYAPIEMPLIRPLPHLELVSSSDACEVVIVECNRWMMGTGFRPAHKNIVVNSGIIQPSCFPGDVKCSHEFCNKLMINAILNPDTCVATSSMDFLGMFPSASGSSETYTLNLPLTKWNGTCDSAESKNFYLTTSNEPKCLGEEGAQGVGLLNSIRHILG